MRENLPEVYGFASWVFSIVAFGCYSLWLFAPKVPDVPNGEIGNLFHAILDDVRIWFESTIDSFTGGNANLISSGSIRSGRDDVSVIGMFFSTLVLLQNLATVGFTRGPIWCIKLYFPAKEWALVVSTWLIGLVPYLLFSYMALNFTNTPSPEEKVVCRDRVPIQKIDLFVDVEGNETRDKEDSETEDDRRSSNGTKDDGHGNRTSKKKPNNSGDPGNEPHDVNIVQTKAVNKAPLIDLDLRVVTKQLYGGG